MSYSYKTGGLVLNAPHCLPLYSFRICHHFLEGIKFPVFVSSSPSSRFVTMTFHFSNSRQVPNFYFLLGTTFSLSASHHLSLSCLSSAPHSHFLCPSFFHFCQPRNLDDLQYPRVWVPLIL